MKVLDTSRKEWEHAYGLINYKGINLDDDKPFCGVGRLKKSIAAILYHCSESLDVNDKPDNEARHKYCPRGKDSWCKYQSDKFTGESTYKSIICIPTEVREVIKPIFSHEDLGADILLKKCLHGQTPKSQ